MTKYQVHYLSDDDTKVDVEDRHYEGIVEIETDVPIETGDQLMEVQRYIGLERGVSSVKIVKIAQIISDDEDGSSFYA